MKLLLLLSFIFFCVSGTATNGLKVSPSSFDGQSHNPVKTKVLNPDSKISTTQQNTKLQSEQQKPTALLLKKPVEKFNTSYSRYLEFGLEYPFNFGLHVRYLTSDSIYIRLGLGFMPSFFLDSFEKLSPSFGYLNEDESKLIADTFENSMYIDLRLAWSPYLKETGKGPYLELGLSRMLYGKGELKGNKLNKAISPGNIFDDVATYCAKTNTYNATAHVGYQIPFEKIKLNVEVGLIRILHSDILSKTSLTASKLMNEKQKNNFKDFLDKKGWIFPTVSGWISFAF